LNEPLEDADKSWPLLLLERVADEVAERERVREKVKTGEWQVPVGDPLHEPAQLSDRFATTPDRLLRDDLGG
jgi:hypothetical protein